MKMHTDSFIRTFSDTPLNKLITRSDEENAAWYMFWLTGEKSIKACVRQGWPRWLAELTLLIFDGAGAQHLNSRSKALALALDDANRRDVDLSVNGPVWSAFRVNSVLPLAIDAIGNGAEPWEVRSRSVIQHSLDNDGKSAGFARTTLASLAALRARDGSAALAAWTAAPHWVSYAAGAGAAVLATRGHEARNNQRIFDASIAALHY
ncbi:MAG: hypothetical protein AAFM92_03305 [Pseudomonadota bacterium]